MKELGWEEIFGCFRTIVSLGSRSDIELRGVINNRMSVLLGVGGEVVAHDI